MKLYKVNNGKEMLIDPKKVDDYNFHQEHDYECDDEEIKGPTRVGIMNGYGVDALDYIVGLEKGDSMIFDDSKGKIVCKDGTTYGFGNEPCMFDIEEYYEYVSDIEEGDGENSRKTFKKFKLNIVIENS